ncbi:MAG: hypothetical protein PHV78_01370 [Patescibacteria group bacterium]|nr:hypothetical protein [Patescibacteria group bacterium]MDD5121194.1 hypothetical protein [Patescibacteria group bacterium]MDD5222006.1 hypothetical protein [Patescibacteria group bacterium]MDD5395887.1 hypothetical protein [Patescibacteria group bacterium]
MDHVAKTKNILLRFRAVDRDIFEEIKKGVKKIETRAATVRYQGIAVGDNVILSCGSQKIKKIVFKIEKFKSIDALLKKYKPATINPRLHTKKEALAMWHSFPGYEEKIKKHGLIAIHLINK